MIPTGQVGHFKKSQKQNLNGRKNGLIWKKNIENLQRAYLHDFYIKERKMD